MTLIHDLAAVCRIVPISFVYRFALNDCKSAVSIRAEATRILFHIHFSSPWRAGQSQPRLEVVEQIRSEGLPSDRFPPWKMRENSSIENRFNEPLESRTKFARSLHTRSPFHIRNFFISLTDGLHASIKRLGREKRQPCLMESLSSSHPQATE